MSEATSISRRTALKGLGLAVGSAAIGVSPSPPAEAALLPPSGRCFIYLDHAARNLSNSSQWVVGALLVANPRLPRQILRRAKRHRLSSADQIVAEIKAKSSLASPAFKQYLYQHLLVPSRKQLLKKRPVLELYSLRASRSVLKVAGERVGLFQLRLLQALLEACDPGRFREVLVYHNLPSLRGVSEKAFNAGLAKVRLRPGTTLETWEHPPVWVQRPTQKLLVDEGIQVADFATYAFYQKYQHGNARWFNIIRPRVRREINALALLPGFLLLK